MPLTALWAYQQADQQVDQFEGEIKASEKRKRLVKLRNIVSDAQKQITKMEDDVTRASARVKEVAQELSILKEDIETLHTLAGQTDDLARIRNLRNEGREMTESLDVQAQLLVTASNEAQEIYQQYRTVLNKAAKARDEYTALKAEYDVEFQPLSEQLDKLKAARDEVGKGVEAQLLEQYERIKKRCTPVVVRLEEDRCGGCNMNLPMSTLQGNKSGYIECENCGRILVIKG